jgi:E3 ubiquitin-protein ligase TRIP12
LFTDTSPSTQTPVARRQKKRSAKRDAELPIRDEDITSKPIKTEKTTPPPVEPSESNDAESPRDMDMDGSDDPFAAGFLGSGRGPPMGLSSTLRALSGMMSGMSSRLRDILNNLRQLDNPSMQLVALEDLSNLLLVSNEDNLSGQFSPDPYVKELVSLMQPNAITGEENPEMMLLACRCIANLMEALRGSVANVVYGGAVPVLCQKLLDIQYIDVAEQALSVSLYQISSTFTFANSRLDAVENICRFPWFHCPRRRLDSVSTVLGLLRHRYAANGRHNGSQLLQKHTSRLLPRHS